MNPRTFSTITDLADYIQEGFDADAPTAAEIEAAVPEVADYDDVWVGLARHCSDVAEEIITAAIPGHGGIRYPVYEHEAEVVAAIAWDLLAPGIMDSPEDAVEALRDYLEE